MEPSSTDKRDRLVAQREELKKLLGRFASKDAHVKDDFHSMFPNYGSDEESNAAEVADYEDDLSIERDLERALQDVDAALAALEKGTYGTCTVCNKPIEEERLALVPATTLCIEHKNNRR